jgi:hypothetical protein
MAQINKTSYNNLYGSSGTTFPTGIPNAISSTDVKAMGQDTSDSFMSIQDNFIDEDSFASDSATKAPSQQSVKAYVDGVAAVKRARVQITGGPTTRAIGTTPQTVLAAPGAGFWYNIISVAIAYDYGAASYNFGATSDIIVRFAGSGSTGCRLSYDIINGGANFQSRLSFYTPSSATGYGLNCPENTKLEIGTIDNGDATTGDGDIQVIVTYTLEAINS